MLRMKWYIALDCGAVTTRALVLELAVEHHVGDLETHVQLDCGSEVGDKANVVDFRS